MKHRILLVVLILAVSFNAPAQTKNTYKFKGTHELSLGLGMYPIDATDITYIMILPITGIYLSERTTSPTINLNYYYHTSNSISVGAEMTFGAIQEKFKAIYSENYSSTSYDTYFNFTPSVRLKWFRRKNLWMYSSLGIGVKIAHSVLNNSEKTTDSYAALNCTIAGIQVGRKNWFGFAEIGTSSSGCIRIGAGYRFNHIK